MGLEDGKPAQGKNLELGASTQETAAEPGAIEMAAQLTQADYMLLRAANPGDPEKPYEKQVRAMFGTEDRYVRDSRAGLRDSVNQEITTGSKLRATDPYEEVQNKVAAMIARGFSDQSTWSKSYQNMVLQRLSLGDENITRDSARNKQTVYDALMAGDRKMAVAILGDAGRTASGQVLEDAVNRFQYREMQKNGIKTDYN
jgi:hypothetical protein